MSNKNKLFLIFTLITLILVFLIYLGFRNQGKVEVSIEVIPDNSLVYINNKSAAPGTVYLKPGVYKFKASKEGFIDDIITVTIDNEREDISLIPQPNSQEAFEWIKDNPDIQIDREAIAGSMSERKAKEIEKNDPIINLLPYDDLIGPFSIDYGPSKKRVNSIFLDINNSSPQGRENALKWLKSQGYDATDLEIIYRDYNQQVFPKELKNE
jgi:PEGA domain